MSEDESAQVEPSQQPVGWSGAAEWRPDPRGEAALRWWDGTAWTEHVHGDPPAEKGDAQTSRTSAGDTKLGKRARAWLGGDVLHPVAQEKIESQLLDGEEIRVVVPGEYGSAIVGTDRRAFVYRKGMMSGAAFGDKLTVYDYQQVSGIELHCGAMSGAVIVRAPGEVGVETSAWDFKKKGAPNKARNAITISRGNMAGSLSWNPYEERVAQLRALISAGKARPEDRSPRSVVPVAVGEMTSGDPLHHNTAAPDAFDQIRKLGELRDAGLLTEEEFTSKKAELLARL